MFASVHAPHVCGRCSGSQVLLQSMSPSRPSFDRKGLSIGAPAPAPLRRGPPEDGAPAALANAAARPPGGGRLPGGTLAEDGAPAPLWLLWAERSDPIHARLREKLGLPPVETAAEAAAADASDFAIARMGGGHVLQTYAMSAPFSYDALREHARAYCAGELRADIHWRKELRERWPSVAAAVAAVAALLYYRWRGRRREKELKTD